MINLIELEKFYNALKLSAEKEYKKNIKKSLFLLILESKGNKRNNIFDNSIIKSIEVDFNSKNELLQNDLICESEKNINEYIITGKGVWFFETKKEIITVKDLIKYLNKKYFYKKVKKSLIKIEKSILFGLIAARAFSKNSLIDCKKNEKILDIWKEIFEKSFLLLKELNIIKVKDKKLFVNSGGNQHIVEKSIRAQSKINSKTNNLYKNGPEANSRFLNIFYDNKFNSINLTFLFNKIFERKLNYDEIIKVIKFCNRISEDKTFDLFDFDKHIFRDIEYDKKIKECLFNL